ADLFREGANHVGIEDVAALERRRHLQVVLDQETNRLAVLRFDPEARENVFHRLEASPDVVASRHAFAHVVKKQGEEQQFRLLQLGKHFCELGLPTFTSSGTRSGTGSGRREGGAPSEVMQVLDRHERVLVDRVAMVEVTDDQSVNGAELRKERNQQT